MPGGFFFEPAQHGFRVHARGCRGRLLLRGLLAQRIRLFRESAAKRLDDYYLRRAGLDYWQYLQWEAVDDWRQLLERLPRERYWYFSKKATRPYGGAQFGVGDVLVFGSESQGLPAEMLAAQEPWCVRIPTRSQVRSLNLSNAVAVAGYEALRQQGGLMEVDLL